MGALNYLAMVIFVVLFLGIGFAIYSDYQRGALEREFEAKAQDLAERVNLMGAQDVGATDYLEIYVPPNCRLSFADNTILANIGSSSRGFTVTLPVSGPILSNQRVKLVLRRTAAGVSLSVA